MTQIQHFSTSEETREAPAIAPFTASKTDIAIFSRDYHVAKRHAINGALQTAAAVRSETCAEA
jgi:hypothetical protein